MLFALALLLQSCLRYTAALAGPFETSLSRAAALAAHRSEGNRPPGLGPGASVPSAWARYPRGPALLAELSKTLADAAADGQRRVVIRIGDADLAELGGDDPCALAPAVSDVARRWRGKVRVAWALPPLAF